LPQTKQKNQLKMACPGDDQQGWLEVPVIDVGVTVERTSVIAPALLYYTPSLA